MPRRCSRCGRIAGRGLYLESLFPEAVGQDGFKHLGGVVWSLTQLDVMLESIEPVSKAGAKLEAKPKLGGGDPVGDRWAGRAASRPMIWNEDTCLSLGRYQTGDM